MAILPQLTRGRNMENKNKTVSMDLRSNSVHQAVLRLGNVQLDEFHEKLSERYVAVRESLDRAQAKQSKVLNSIKKRIENSSDEVLKKDTLHYFDDTILDDFRHYQA
jgi:hypothetical protein